MFDLAVIGSSIWDEWLLPEENTPLRGVIDHFGGPAANIAVHIAALGFSVSLATEFGSDEFSSIYERYLMGTGVDLSFAQNRAGPMARCEIAPGRSFRWIEGNRKFPRPANSKILAIRNSTNAVFWTDSLPASGDLTGHERSYWAPQWILREATAECLHAITYNWTTIFLNAKEAALIERETGKNLGDLSRLNSGTKWAVTNESDPILVIRNGHCAYYEVPQENVVTSTGAGDAFAAGYCAGDLRGWDEINAVRMGQALAGAVIAQVGCQLDSQQLRPFVVKFLK